jgi:hypothetical protein
MPSGATVRIVGLDKLQKRLGTSFKPAMRGATKAIALEIQGKIAPYPRSTIANSPGQRRWYERGFGPRWRRQDGTVGGRKTSETLGRRWGVEREGSIGAVVGNIASYSPYVHDHDKRARFHKRRGWVSDREAVEKVERAGTIPRIVNDAIMHALGQK